MNSEETKVNRLYKDSVFKMLFNDKYSLLSLYNAVNGTNYENADDLEINTLEDGVFMKMKNDISFVFGFELNLYEHQSTKCGNMPLRFLFYVTKLYSGMVENKDLHGSKSIKIPTPRFVVFYNGEAGLEDKSYQRLSDHFEKEVDASELELTVTVINVNENHSPEILNACKTLKDYSIFVGKIRKYVKIMTVEEAIEIVIDECINEDVLAGFLRRNRVEVHEMSVFEYNEELHLKNVHREGYDEGYGEGHTDGYGEGYNKAKEESDLIIAEKDAKIAELEAKLAKQN